MASNTRDRILDSARRRFIDHGYDGTSLRDIAEDLGFTKAALYYHFQTKEQILEALLEPANSVVTGLLARLEAADGPQGWADALYWMIDLLHEHIDVFMLMQRNRTVIGQLEGLAPLSDHREMHVRIEAAVHHAAADLAGQIRLVAAVATVTGFDDWAPTLLVESPPDELRAGLKATVAAILGLRPPRGPRPARPTR
jgi:AcrR family transcriptional regulator